LYNVASPAKQHLLLRWRSNICAQALIKILTEPKNAIVKQYKKLFALNNADLEFTPDALEAVAAKALKRNTW